jgi:hypothetical protein
MSVSVTKPTIDPATGNPTVDPETGDPTGDLTKLECSWAANCLIKYDWNYTPRINTIVPSILYPNMIMSVGVDPWNAMNYRTDPD